MVPKSMVGSSLLAYTMTAKFVDGLPFYHVESQLASEGFQPPFAPDREPLGTDGGRENGTAWDMLREK